MIVAVDIFCGAGGLTRGLLNAGVNVVLGIDVNGDYRRTYEANNAPATFLCRDVRDLTKKEICKFLPEGDYALALVGCAPCQPFSSHRRFREACGENRLLMEFLRLALELRPDWVFMENVPGLAKVPGFSAYRRFVKSLSDANYHCACDTVDAKRFGVPQTRRRFVLLAGKHESVSLPQPSHGPEVSPYRTVRDAIGHLPRIAAGASCDNVPNHRAAAITEVNLRRLDCTPADGGSRSAWPHELALECHKDAEGHEDVYGRMRWNSPAPTLTCRCYSISNGRYGHPEQNRAVSLREAANLQTFPDDYEFFGKSQRSVGEQIGNAVPVALAEAIGRHVILLSGTRVSQKKKNNDRRRR